MAAAPTSNPNVERADILDLLDWKRRIFELYSEVRCAPRTHHGWQHWRDARDALFRSHPQTPVAPKSRNAFERLEYFPYDPALRMFADVAAAPGECRAIAGSAGSQTLFSRFALAR